MPRKARFKLEIRRVKLNPEQAVLECDCFDNEISVTSTPPGGGDIIMAYGCVSKGEKDNLFYDGSFNSMS